MRSSPWFSLVGGRTIAAMLSLLCSSQILVGWELGQSIPTVVHTVPELSLWTKGTEWSHPSTMSSYSVPYLVQDQVCWYLIEDLNQENFFSDWNKTKSCHQILEKYMKGLISCFVKSQHFPTFLDIFQYFINYTFQILVISMSNTFFEYSKSQDKKIC